MDPVHSFRTRLEAGRLPPAVAPAPGGDLAPAALADLFESQLLSRHLDLAARRLAKTRRAFYSIGSAGHEGNAAIARALRLADMAFLHYRSGAFLLERARQKPGTTALWDMALSFVASADDPCSGGRHKVLGSKDLFIPPQTSTIASHLPKAVGAAFGVTLARTLKKEDALLPWDAVVACSFGDASANHSTALGAFNAAAWSARRGLKTPILFICEDNGLGISVPTPERWIADQFSNRPHIAYFPADGRDIRDVHHAARAAAEHARLRGAPAFLHMRAVRLMGHAGSDVEHAYRERAAIAADEDDDPLLHSARILIEAGIAPQDALLDWDAEIAARVARVMEEAAGRPRLETAAAVAVPIAPAADGRWREGRRGGDGAPTEAAAPREPLPLSRTIAHTLGALMAEDDDIVVFGEDVGAKGGVYGATMGLQKAFGPARVFDSLLDEQTVLGAAIGLAHNGFLPIPEIQFLAYVHNAEDQIRGEAATLSFFSQSQFANPMVIRVAGLGYQRGFGGHFHNDNALGVFRDVPGLILACPSSAQDAAPMLREGVRLAREEGRVVVFLEPIALYGVRDLHEEGDGLMLATPSTGRISLGAVGVHDDDVGGGAPDVAILTYGNGVAMARRAARRLRQDEGLGVRVVDARWLAPFAPEPLLAAAEGAAALVVLDECRRSGSWSEAVVTALAEAGDRRPLARVTAADSFIPLGPAATVVLPSEEDVLAAARAVAGRSAGPGDETTAPVPASAPDASPPAAGEGAGMARLAARLKQRRSAPTSDAPPPEDPSPEGLESERPPAPPAVLQAALEDEPGDARAEGARAEDAPPEAAAPEDTPPDDAPPDDAPLDEAAFDDAPVLRPGAFPPPDEVSHRPPQDDGGDAPSAAPADGGVGARSDEDGLVEAGPDATLDFPPEPEPAPPEAPDPTPLTEPSDGAYRFKDLGELRLERDAEGLIVIERFPENEGAELHAHGRGPFCRFDLRRRDRRGGVFVILEDEGVVFVSRTRKLDERFGYGRGPGYRRITAAMCRAGGPASACRINTLVLEAAKAGKTLSVRFAPASDCRIPLRQVEERLVEAHAPRWNEPAETRVRRLV